VIVATAFACLAASACGGEVPTHAQAGAPGVSHVVGVGQVRREFRRNGLPLTKLLQFSGTRIFDSDAAGPVFRVDVYPSLAVAAAADGFISYFKPAGYRVRGDVTTGRRWNVVVTFEEGRARVRGRVDAALESLR
jgi:hypothetical protein